MDMKHVIKVRDEIASSLSDIKEVKALFLSGSLLYDPTFDLISDIDITVFVDNPSREIVFRIASALKQYKDYLCFIGPPEQPSIYIFQGIPIQIIVASAYLSENKVRDLNGIILRRYSTVPPQKDWRWDRGIDSIEMIYMLRPIDIDITRILKKILISVQAYGPPFRITGFNLLKFVSSYKFDNVDDALRQFKKELHKYTKLDFIIKRAQKAIDLYLEYKDLELMIINYSRERLSEPNLFQATIRTPAFHPKWWNHVYGQQLYRDFLKALQKYYDVKLEYDVTDIWIKFTIDYHDKKIYVCDNSKGNILEIKEKIEKTGKKTVIIDNSLYIIYCGNKTIIDIAHEIHMPLFRHDNIVLFDFDGTLKEKTHHTLKGRLLNRLFNIEERRIKRNITALERHIDHGDYVIIATYRRRSNLNDIREFMKEIEIELPIYHGVGMVSPYIFKRSCSTFFPKKVYGDTKLDKLMKRID